MDLEAYLDEQLRQQEWSGSALVRWRGQTLVDRGFRDAVREDGQPNTPETAFQIASISKQFTAAAILLLQERGALSVQDRIAAWVPGCPETWDSITIHHLLTHTSGIVHWQDLPELSLLEPNTRENLLHIFQTHPLKFPPGAGWYYSSPAYVLLAHIVEQVTRQPYAAFLQQSMFHPLVMTRTGVGNQAPRPELRARGYEGSDPAQSFDLDTVSIGAGDIWSTTQDLARWDAALSKPGLLSARSLQQMFASHVAVPDGITGISDMRYGYGWFLAALEGHQLRFHPGDNAGFSSVNIHLPDDDAVVVLLSNQEVDPEKISLTIVGALLDNEGSTFFMGLR